MATLCKDSQEENATDRWPKAQDDELTDSAKYNRCPETLTSLDISLV